MENVLKDETIYGVTENGEVYDGGTGEVISLEEIKKAKQKKIYETVAQANLELKDLGLQSNLIVCEYRGEKYNCISIKPNHQFDKMFRTSMQDVILKYELSLNAKALLLTIMPFIVFPSNIVSIKKCKTIEDIGELVGFKKSATYKAFKELIDKQIINKTKFNGQTQIYVNPYLISSGGIVEKSTIDMFNE